MPEFTIEYSCKIKGRRTRPATITFYEYNPRLTGLIPGKKYKLRDMRFPDQYKKVKADENGVIRFSFFMLVWDAR